MAELVVFYSLTGKSRQVAEWLAAGLNADIEEIVEQRPRGFGFRGIFRSAFETLFRRCPPIRPMIHRQAIFDRVILAAPVWGGSLASPARSWLYRYGRSAKSLGLALQSGDGVDHARALNEFEGVIGCGPKPMLAVSEYDFRDRVAERKVAGFVRSITSEAARFPVG